MNTGHVLYLGDDSVRSERVAAGVRDSGLRVDVERDRAAVLRRVEEGQVDCVVYELDPEEAEATGFRDQLHGRDPNLSVLLLRPGKTDHGVASVETLGDDATTVVQLAEDDRSYAHLVASIRTAAEQAGRARRLQRQSEQNRALATLGRAALEGGSLEAVCQSAVETVASALDVEFVELLELVSDEALLLRAGVGWDEGLVGTATVGTGEHSQAGYTLTVSEPVVVEDLGSESRFSGPALLRDHHVASGISVVVGSTSDPWGVLGAHTTRTRAFSDEEVTFVQNVANVLAARVERQEAIDQLSESRERFREIADLSPDPLVRLAPSGELLYVSAGAEPMLGYGPAELVGTAFHPYVTDESLPTAVDGFERVLAGEVVRDLDVGMVAADGTEVPVEITASPVYEDGSVALVQCVVRDVSARQQRERELELKERAMDAAPIGIVLTDPRLDDNPVVYANEGFARLTGYDRDSAVGRNCRYLQGDASDPEAIREMRRAIRAAEPVSVDIVNYRADGTPFWNKVTIAPTLDDDGSVVNFVGFQQDVTQRKEQEFELERQIDLFEQAQTMADVGAWELDLSAGREWNTDQVKRIHGIPEDEELSIERSLGCYHPDDRATIERAFERAVEDGDPYDLELGFTDCTGVDKWVRTRGEPQFEDGELVRIRGTIHDITGQKRTEIELTRKNELLTTLVDELPAGVLVETADRTVELANSRLLQLVGVSEETDSLVGADCVAFASDIRALFEEPAAFTAGIEARIADGVPVDREQLKLADGRVFERSYRPIEFPTDRGHLWVYWDVTDRVDRARELRQFEQAVEQAGSAIYITDTEEVITYVNPAFEELTGYGTADAIGMPASELRSAGDDESSSVRRGTSVESGLVWEGEVVKQRASGEQYTAIQTVAPIIDEEGESAGYVAIEADITDRLLNKQRLEVLNRLLRHNVRNNLNIIGGHVELIDEAVGDRPDVDESVRTIEATLERLVQESKKGRELEQLLRPEDVGWQPLDAELESLEELLARTFDSSRISVEVDAEGVRVPDVIKYVLLELVENALTHGGDDVSVSITGTVQSGNQIELLVTDTGPGIPPLERAVIERGTETPLEHSQGIGLWLCYWLVQKAGGSLSFVDATEGTSISVVTPTIVEN